MPDLREEARRLVENPARQPTPVESRAVCSPPTTPTAMVDR